MKTLSIQQPWASLICAGIKDVENRTWKAAEIPGKILIHASSKKVTQNFFSEITEEMESHICNHVFFGNLPHQMTSRVRCSMYLWVRLYLQRRNTSE